MCAGFFVVFVGLGVALLALDNFSDVLQSIGKDPSLTGRTLLWSHAASIIADHPFGLGLQAFWVEGNRDAIRFWESNYITGHSGFHFHDLWLETGVELGIVGILIAAWTTVVVFISILRWVLRDPRPESCFFFGFIIFILSRTFGEVAFWSLSAPDDFHRGLLLCRFCRTQFAILRRKSCARRSEGNLT
jgi:exopolysaccharide production protein ExoQ